MQMVSVFLYSRITNLSISEAFKMDCHILPEKSNSFVFYFIEASGPYFMLSE